MDTTKSYVNPNQNYFSSGATFDTSIKQPTAISTSTLTSTENPIKLPETPTLPTPTNLGNFDTNAILQGINEPTKSAGFLDAATAKTGDLYQRLFGKSTDKQAMEATAGIPEKKTLLTQAIDRFRTTTMEQNQLIQEQGAIPITASNNAIGRKSVLGMQRESSQALRDNAIKQYQVTSKGLFQQAEIANLRDDIKGAQDDIDKAIEYKYAPIEQEISYFKDFVIPTLKDKVTGEKADKLKALEFQNNERTRLLTNAKEDSKTGSALALAAMKNFPNDKQAQYNAQLAMEEAQKEQPDINKIFSLVGQYQNDPIAIKSALADLEYKRASTAKIYSDMAKTEAEKAKILAETSTNTTNAKVQLQNNEALSIAKELLSSDAKGKSSAIGASFAKLVPFGQSLGLQGDRSAFEARLNTLKSNLTLDNLKLLKGSMSDKDLLFLNSIGSSLTTDMSEEEFNTEIKKVIKKLEDAGATSGNTTVTVGGTNYNVGQVYQDATGTKWIVDSSGKWTKQ